MFYSTLFHTGKITSVKNGIKIPCYFIRQENAKIKVNSILIIPDMFCILVCNGVIGLPVGLSPSPSKLDSVTNLLLRLSYIA